MAVAKVVVVGVPKGVTMCMAVGVAWVWRCVWQWVWQWVWQMVARMNTPPFWYGD